MVAFLLSAFSHAKFGPSYCSNPSLLKLDIVLKKLLSSYKCAEGGNSPGMCPSHSSCGKYIYNFVEEICYLAMFVNNFQISNISVPELFVLASLFSATQLRNNNFSFFLSFVLYLFP